MSATKMLTPLGVLLAIVDVALAIAWLLDLKVRRLALDRGGEGYAEFQRHFDRYREHEAALAAVYAYFESLHSGIRRFAVRPSDSVGGVYGIVDEDADDMVHELLHATGRTMPDGIEQQFPLSVDTVEDVVEFILQCPLKRD